MSKEKEKSVTATIRVPLSDLLQVDRLARDDDTSRNAIINELIENGLTLRRGMTEIDKIIEDSKGWFGGIDVDEMIKKLKDRRLTLYEKAYLAHKLDYQTRMNLFEKMNLKEELSEVNMIDELLSKAKEERPNKIVYNIHKFSNDLKIPLTDFGMEYLYYHLGKDDIDKLMKLRPEIYKAEETEEEELEEGEEEEELEEEEIPIIESKKPLGRE